MKITSRNRQWFLKIYIQDSFIPETKIKLAVFHNEVKKLFLICDIHDTASEDEVLENLNDTQSKKLIDIEKLIIWSQQFLENKNSQLDQVNMLRHTLSSYLIDTENTLSSHFSMLKLCSIPSSV